MSTGTQHRRTMTSPPTTIIPPLPHFTTRKEDKVTTLNNEKHHTRAQSDRKLSLQPIDWQREPAACLPMDRGQRMYILLGEYGPHWGAYHPYLNSPGHQAFRSQLRANELGGLRFTGVGPKSSTIQHRSARATPLRQPGAPGIWDWCHPQGHHARRPSATIPT